MDKSLVVFLLRPALIDCISSLNKAFIFIIIIIAIIIIAIIIIIIIISFDIINISFAIIIIDIINITNIIVIIIIIITIITSKSCCLAVSKSLLLKTEFSIHPFKKCSTLKITVVSHLNILRIG